MQSLLNKKFVLGISGGIAAYKAPELARQLMQEGASVQVVMTEAAQQFVELFLLAFVQIAQQFDHPLFVGLGHGGKGLAAGRREAHAERSAVPGLGLAHDQLLLFKLVNDGGHIAASDHHPA